MSPRTHEKLAAAVVWTTWAALTLVVLVLVVHYATNLPRADELELLPLIGQQDGLHWFDVWAQHNEHRMPLAKLVYWASVAPTNDVRAPMIVSVLALSCTAAALIRAASVARGRTSFADVLFPLAWLQWTQAENLLSGFQIAFVVPAVLGGLALAALLAARGDAARVATWRFAVPVLLLPWAAMPGLIASPPIAAWCAWAGARARRSDDEATRRAGTKLLVLAFATVVLCALYFVGYVSIAAHRVRFEPRVLVESIGLFLARPTGWHVVVWEKPMRVLLFAAIAVATVVLALVEAKRDREHRALLAGLAAVALGGVAIGAALGIARSTDDVNAAIAGRYATLGLPWISCVVAAWTVVRPRWAATACATVATMATLALWPQNFRTTRAEAQVMQRTGLRFLDDLRAGATDAELAAKHWKQLYADEQGLRLRLAMLHDAHLPPYDQPLTLDPRAAMGDRMRLFFMFDAQPVGYATEEELVPRRSRGEWVLVAPSRSELRFALPPPAPGSTARVLTARYGLLASAFDDPRFDGARFRVELRAPDGETLTLLETRIEPAEPGPARVPRALRVEIAPDARGEIALVTDDEPGRTMTSDWCWWTDVAFE